jgi:hypothetical protein
MDGYHAIPTEAIMTAIIDGAQHIRTHVDTLRFSIFRLL